MKFIKPTPITTAMLTSSTRAENDYTAYSAGTTYTLAQRCISTTTHRIYESVQAGNLNHALTDTAWWLDIGPTNRWAMFDTGIGSVTSVSTPLTVVLVPGTISALALLDMVGSSVTVSMLDAPAGASVYSQTFTLVDGAIVMDWYAYFFEEIVPQTALVVSGLPSYAAGQLTVTITAATTASCGTLAVGKLVDCGSTLTNPIVSIIDYSRKETDIYGVTDVIERSYAKRIEAQFILDAYRIDYVARQLALVRSTPCIWIADDDFDGYESLLAYGFYKDWGISIAYPTHALADITIEGLT